MKRAIGIIRVSELAGRDVDSERFHTVAVQRDIIARDCERLGLTLTQTMEELDVSGGAPLGKRPALKIALEQVELGSAEAIVFAYRDRMDRSIEHGSELIRRMDAKGALLIAGGKQITHATHDGWRSATLESFLNEDQRRAISAKMSDVHDRCVERGVAPFRLPPGYRRRADGVAELAPETADLIRRAWKLRAAGDSIRMVRIFLKGGGVELTDSKVGRMLRNRFYLGELHRGGRVNLHSHEPLVTPELFDAVQATVAPRGRLGRSERLLARQGVLYCACGGRMSVGRTTSHYIYRCRAESCDTQARISADLIERHVLEYVSDLTRGLVGRANGEAGVQEAHAALDAAQQGLDKLIAGLEAAALMDEPAAFERAMQMKQIRDVAKANYEHALAHDEAATVAITAEEVLRDGTLDERRALVKAVIERIDIAQGRGLERVTIFPRL